MRDQTQRRKRSYPGSKGGARPGHYPDKYVSSGPEENRQRRPRRRQLEELAELETEEMLRLNDAEEAP